MARAQAAAADIEAQLVIESGHRPILLMIQMAKREAANAMSALVEVDPFETRKIQRLQNEVRRFTDLCCWLQDVIRAGREAEEQITREDRDEMIEILAETPEGQRELINLGLLEGDTPHGH